ncbi:MAG: hypothetical protein ACREQ9_12600, partial [Candidatus Binatia bacterium]
MFASQRLAIRIALSFGIACGLLAGCTGTDEARDRPVVDLLARPTERAVLETRRLGFGAGDRRHLVRGWSRDEWNRDLDVRFVWANAKEAVIRFRLLDVQELQFLVKLVPYPTSRPQRIDVLVNGNHLTRIDPR